MNLSPEDLSLFDDVLADGPTATPPPAPAVQTPSARVLPPATPTADPGLPPPVAAKPSLIMPACTACGVDLNPDNASLLGNGSWKHIGCPASTPAAPAVVAPPAAPKPRKPRAEKPAAEPMPLPAPRPETYERADGTPVVAPPMAPAQVVIFELGPKTQALIGALIAKLG